jgi:hypothetical protein
MKKSFCVLALAALLGACEQKTEVVTPASQTPNPVNTALQGERPKSRAKSDATLSTSSSEKNEVKSDASATKTETTTEVTEKKELEMPSVATPNP